MTRADRMPASTPFALLGTLAVGALLGACVPENAPIKHDPKGRSAFYMADQEVDNVFELFEIGKKPGVSRKLSGELEASSQVRSVTPGPRGRHVAYIADQDQLGLLELFITSLKTGVNRKLNEAGVAFGDGVSVFRFGPRERFVYFLQQEQAPAEGGSRRTQLYRVNLKSDVIERLNGEFGADGDVSSFELDARGKSLVYVADQESPGVPEAYHVDLKSLVVTKLHEDFEGSERVGIVEFGARGRFLYYVANPVAANRFELFRYDIKKKVTLKLSGPLVHEFGVLDFDIDRKGRYAAYSAHQDSAFTSELYRTRIKDLSNLKISPDPGETFLAQNFEIDRRGRSLIHDSLGSVSGSGLYAADLKDGEHTQLNAELEHSQVTEFQLGRRGRYLTYQTSFGELFGVRLKKPQARLLNGQMDESLLCSFIGMKGRHAYYIDASNTVPDDPGNVYRANLKKDELLLLNTGIADVHAGSIDPRERFVTFTADVGNGQELFRSTTKDAEVTKLTPTLVPGGNVAF